MKIACTDCARYKNENKSWTDELLQRGFSFMEIAVSRLPSDEKLRDEIINNALSRGLTLNLHAPFGINNISSSDYERRVSSIRNVKNSRSSYWTAVGSDASALMRTAFGTCSSKAEIDRDRYGAPLRGRYWHFHPTDNYHAGIHAWYGEPYAKVYY